MGKSCTNDLWELDVRKLARDGQLFSGRSLRMQWSSNGTTMATISLKVATGSVTLDYQHQPNGDDWQNMNYSVRLAYTPCNLGGERVWWLCPAAGCGRRVAVLYLGSSGIFACRHCYGLAYRSQMETAHDRSFRRADNLRARLGWVPGIAHPVGDKPKGMHWRTYERLTEKYYRHASQAGAGSMEWLEFMRARVDRI